MIVFDRVRMRSNPWETVTRLFATSTLFHVANEKAATCRSILRIGLTILVGMRIAAAISQHRGEEEEVLATDESHFEIRKLKLLKLQRGIKSAEGRPPEVRTRVLFAMHSFVGRSAEYLQSGAL